MRLFAVVVMCCALTLSSCTSLDNITDWEEYLNNRIKMLQDDHDLFNKDTNFTFHVFYYNVTQRDTGSPDDIFSNETTCVITEKTTICRQVNIFEVVETFPSTTEYLEITNSSTQILRHSILSNLTHLIHLKLTNNSIQFITSKLFIGLDNLRILNLSDNNIRALTKVAFVGCPNLVTLDLSRNRIISLNFIPAALAPLKNLTTISLARNDIKRIEWINFAGMRNSPLKSLDFTYCMLARIERGSFGHLNNLETLILQVNYLNAESVANATYNLSSIKKLNLKLLPLLRDFPTEAMLNLVNTSIESIDFSFSEISKIPADAFPYLSTLHRLRFSNCLILQIEDGAFDGLTSLQELDLTENRLSQIPTAISVLKNLTALSLVKQELKNTDRFKIPSYSLSNLTSLSYLLLQQNGIFSEMTEFSFHGLENLTVLVLYKCSINMMKGNVFKPLSSLEFLDLSYNNIYVPGDASFLGLNNLKVLSLRSNGLLIGYNSQLFAHTKSLEMLLLSDNEIKYLRPNLFSGLTHLRYLNMSGNKIMPWNISLFEGSAPVELFLRKNEISHVTPAMLEDFKMIEYVDVSSNPFDCSSCQMEEFRTWILSSNNSYTQDRMAYDCFSPPELYEYSIFQSDLQLDHCILPSFVLEIRMAIGFSTFAVCMVILIIVGYYFRWYFRYWWFHLHASVKRLSTSSSGGNPYFYDAFVSYNSADIKWVTRELIPNLENQNSTIKLCLHDRDFEVGRLITENILESIDKSRKVLLVLTSSFVKSEWCLFELHVAQHRLFHDTRDALVLVQVEPLQKQDISKHLSYLMKTRVLLMWPENPEKRKAFWVKLHKILSS